MLPEAAGWVEGLARGTATSHGDALGAVRIVAAHVHSSSEDPARCDAELAREVDACNQQCAEPPPPDDVRRTV